MAINNRQKELIGIYVFALAVMLLAINWESISWMFNYREVTGLVADSVASAPQSQTVSVLGVNTIAQADTGSPKNVAVYNKYPRSSKANSLQIPSLGIDVPIVIGQSNDIVALEKDLNNGVVYYPGSVAPPVNGQIVVLGHSAPLRWPHIKYDWVFSNISKLQAGDKIILYFNNYEYVYTVVNSAIIAKGQDIGQSNKASTNSILTLVSCWPPGKDQKRIAVDAELVR